MRDYMKWITVERFPQYEICSTGSIRNKKTKRLLCTESYNVRLEGKKGRKTVSVLCLYAEAFLEKPKRYRPENFSVVLKNQKKNPFSSKNLEWNRIGPSKSYPLPENARTAKLTPKDVVLIREMYSRGATQADIASMYDCTQENIHFIVKRKTWRNI